MSQQEQKQQAAEAALEYIQSGDVVGVGTGSTVNCFINALAKCKGKIDGAVASSKASEEKLRSLGIPVLDLNSVNNVSIYIDGADECSPQGYLIKGGGAALTGEKIVAACAEKFVCIIDESKQVDVLGRKFPLPIEVIAMARSYVARQIFKLGGDPAYRQGVVTDYGQVILDCHNLNLVDPVAMEKIINAIPGVVTNGIFAQQKADIVLISGKQGISIIE